MLLFAAACTIYAEEAPKYKVGIQHNGSIVLPDNQILTPAGSQVQFAGRPHAIAIRPDEKTAALSNDGGKGVINGPIRRLVRTTSRRHSPRLTEVIRIMEAIR